MNTLRYLRYILFITGLLAIDAQAGIELQGIIETSYQECESLGNEAMAIQSIRYERNSSRPEFMKTITVLIEQELGPQPLLLRRIQAVAQWVYHYYPADFDPELVGQTYAGECKTKTFGQIKLLIESGKEDQKRKAWESVQPSHW
jgi:hypothetical protein